MSSRARTAVCLLTLGALLAIAPGAWGEIVLLANGALFEGAVERTPDGVLVHGDGSLVRLRPAEVEHIAPTVEAAYEWKRQQLGPERTADAHLGLADWALQNQLWPQAARELLDARVLEPHSRRLELLERRLDQLSQAPAPSRTVAAPPPIETPAPDEPHPLLPPGGVEQFTRRIQPVLLNSCASVGCHGCQGGVGGLALDLAPLRGYGDARSTERNLQVIVATILRDSQPGESIMRAAVGPHAGVNPVTGARRNEMLERLAVWVQGVAIANRPPEASAEPSSELSPATQASSGVVQASATEAAEPLSADRKLVDRISEEVEAPIGETAIRRGVTLQRVEPRDEFDPEVFNTRYRRPQDDEPMSP